MAQYDEIAGEYDRLNRERADRSCIMVPSAKFYLGELKGMDVLDLACGSGFFTRYIKQWGAANVMGVDISQEMITGARQNEKKALLGIDYKIGDASEIGKLGSFDVVFAAFLLHYAPTVEKLHAMCANIRKNLKKGGKFISFNENPFLPMHSGIQYDVEAKASESVKDGVKIERIHYKAGERDFSFTHYHYEPATYELALSSAGFSKIEWKPFVKGENANNGFPPGYWDNYLKDFSIRVLECA